MVAVAAALAACDRAVPAAEIVDRPPLHIVATSPRPGQRDFPLEQAIRVRFDRLLKPTTVSRQSILVTPGRLDPKTRSSPAGAYLIEPRYDPYERTAVFQLGAGERYSPVVLHTALLRPPDKDSDTTGLRAFDGAVLAQPFVIEFTSGQAVTDPNHDVDDTWPAASYCNETAGTPSLPSIRSVFTSCQGASCHGGAASKVAVGLDLSSAQGLRATALKMPAHELSRSETPGRLQSSPAILGDGMPRIDPGSPGNSYLMYKLIIQVSNYPNKYDPAGSEDHWEKGLSVPEPPDPAELKRLRDAFVMLEPMPLGSSLRVDQMRALVAWIGLGAEVVDCP